MLVMPRHIKQYQVCCSGENVITVETKLNDWSNTIRTNVLFVKDKPIHISDVEKLKAINNAICYKTDAAYAIFVLYGALSFPANFKIVPFTNLKEKQS